jgi:hypothetical protein
MLVIGYYKDAACFEIVQFIKDRFGARTQMGVRAKKNIK